jgi:hypothetical protein
VGTDPEHRYEHGPLIGRRPSRGGEDGNAQSNALGGGRPARAGTKTNPLRIEGVGEAGAVGAMPAVGKRSPTRWRR